MLTEVPNVRQVASEGRRRWFSGDGLELVVWYDGPSARGFQLCYDNAGHNYALTWTKDAGLRHHAVDQGDADALGMKQTPILVNDGTPDVKALLNRFEPVAGNLPAAIRNLVIKHLTPRLQHQG